MLTWDDDRHSLKLEEMDGNHREFLSLLEILSQSDDTDFTFLFQKLVDHTRLHFAEEGRLMRATRFPALGEHEGEHHRIYGELMQFNRAIKRGRLALARAYVKKGLTEWFELHLSTMDSAVAAHVIRQDDKANIIAEAA